MSFEEALKQAAREQEQDRRRMAERQREDQAREQQAAGMLRMLGQDVVSTCRARNLPLSAIATSKSSDGYLRGVGYSFTLVEHVWQVGQYQIDQSGQIYTSHGRLEGPRHGDGFKKAFERDYRKAVERFGVVSLVKRGTPLKPVARVYVDSDYSGSEVAIGDDGKLYQKGHREPLMVLLARCLTKS